MAIVPELVPVNIEYTTKGPCTGESSSVSIRMVRHSPGGFVRMIFSAFDVIY